MTAAGATPGGRAGTQLIVITGLSGSGKSVALKALEDAAYHATDNLPAELLSELVESLERAGGTRIAVSIDARTSATLGEFRRQLQELKARGVDARVLFLEAQQETLIKRFSETRRRHPLACDELTVAESIARERELLAEMGDAAHHIDTSDLNPNALRAWIKQFTAFDPSGFTLLFQSFGFKHGIPLDADLVFDVRCLPNPFYDPALRALTGRDPAVIAFLEAQAAVGRMLEDIHGYVERWLPCFIADNRSYLTVAIGCTGGQHRSVYFAETLARRLGPAQRVMVRHRELS